ncbi:MAG: hypothetical protein ACOCX5_02235 [Chloroflexota bacterium]
MYPEDRVLVGVIRRKSDLNLLLHERWYRIPELQMPHGVDTEYLAFFVGKRILRRSSSGIHYYGRVSGFELAHRRDLLPDEPAHPRATERYFRMALESVHLREPPITNNTNRTITFIYTTWDRFEAASTIHDLYSQADHFVERIQTRLREAGISADRLWQAQRRTSENAPGLHIHQNVDVMDRSAQGHEYTLRIGPDDIEDDIFACIVDKLNQSDGPVTINIPLEHF